MIEVEVELTAVEDVRRPRGHARSRPFRYGVAAIALGAALAGAPVAGVAWADSTASDVTSTVTRAGPADNGSSLRGDSDEPNTSDSAEKDEPAVDREPADDPDVDEGDTEAPAADDPSDSPEPPAEVAEGAEGDVPEPAQPTRTESNAPSATEPGRDSTQEIGAVRESLSVSRPVANSAHPPTEDRATVATLEPPAELVVVATPDAQPEPAAAPRDDVNAVEPAAAATPGPAETKPAPPQPLSPIAELWQLPGRLVNAVLDALDFTSSANSPTLPVSLQPVNDAIFATFRELERLAGLHRTPPPQPAIPTLTYTGPTTRPTPTVAQFLNASAAGYVLGSTPGGLVPFTANGFQMSSTNIFSGMVGRAWVTPEGQLIIAYQGTTGGSHLLFNPLITISQVLADLQVVFTGTTPLAFYDALDFAERVQAEAALQGYTADDIFVTGHSLGGWEAQFVAQRTGLAGIGFEAPGINTVVPGNGADAMFVNIGTYGSSAPYMSTDLPGLQPFMPPYVPGGGSKPHYGPIVMIGDPSAMTPLYNASTLWGKSVIGSMIFLVDYLGNFFQYHLPGVQAYHLDVTPDPGVVLWLGTARGPVHTGYGALTIPELMKAASDDGILFRP